MQEGSRRRVIALAVAAAVVVGVGAGVAFAQTSSPSPPGGGGSSGDVAESLGHDAFLDDIAAQLGVERVVLDDALEAMALDEVQWAQDNGFISEDEAEAIRERIRSEDESTGDPRGFVGHHEFVGIGFGHLAEGPGLLEAAAEFLGLSEGELVTALETETLAEVAEAEGKSVQGLQDAIREQVQARLDEAVEADMITQTQANALLERFDGQIEDLVNGISPQISELAERLGVERAALEEAIQEARLAQVNAARAEGLITAEQAQELRARIRSGSGFLGGLGGFGGFGPGGSGSPCGEFGPGGPGFGRPGPGFGSEFGPGWDDRSPSMDEESEVGAAIFSL